MTDTHKAARLGGDRPGRAWVRRDVGRATAQSHTGAPATCTNRFRPSSAARPATATATRGWSACWRRGPMAPITLRAPAGRLRGRRRSRAVAPGRQGRRSSGLASRSLHSASPHSSRSSPNPPLEPPASFEGIREAHLASLELAHVLADIRAAVGNPSTRTAADTPSRLRSLLSSATTCSRTSAWERRNCRLRAT